MNCRRWESIHLYCHTVSFIQIFSAFANGLELECLSENDMICNLVSDGFLQIDKW